MGMRDERSEFARFAEALTLQVSRLAWAFETVARGAQPAGTFEREPCPNCGSMLVLTVSDSNTCLACLASKRGTPDV